MPEYLDFIIPAHNESETVEAVSIACLQAAEEIGRNCTVTVVADHCSDNTRKLAESAGARVIERNGASPSKSQAVQEGIRSTTNETIALVDADVIGLRAEHLTNLARPILLNQVALSVGVIDYGSVLSPLVRRFPWSSGQRVIRRNKFDWEDSRLDGYALEILMDESIGLSRGFVYSTILTGVRHHNKYRKSSVVDGLQANLRMWRSIATSMEDIDFDGVTAYFDSIRIRDASEKVTRPVLPTAIGTVALRMGSKLFHRSAQAV